MGNVLVGDLVPSWLAVSFLVSLCGLVFRDAAVREVGVPVSVHVQIDGVYGVRHGEYVVVVDGGQLLP